MKYFNNVLFNYYCILYYTVQPNVAAMLSRPRVPPKSWTLHPSPIFSNSWPSTFNTITQRKLQYTPEFESDYSICDKINLTFLIVISHFILFISFWCSSLSSRSTNYRLARFTDIQLFFMRILLCNVSSFLTIIALFSCDFCFCIP